MQELDGLRGLAALAVFADHTLWLHPGDKWIAAFSRTPFGIVCDGHVAVVLFFVLSGFVLTLPFRADPGAVRNPAFYPSFVVRRVLRIYPAQWMTVSVYLACAAAIAPLNDPRYGLLQHGVQDGFQILRHLFLVAGLGTNLLYLPDWSLVVEMQLSLLAPLLIAAFVLGGRLLQLTICLGAFVLFHSHDQTLHHLPMFVLGVALARYWDRLRLVRWRWSAAIAALALYGNRHLAGFAPLGSDALTASGAALLILCSASGGFFSAVLLLPPVQYLGRISYGLYLLHMPVLLCLLKWLYPVAPSVILFFPAGLLLTCLAATLCHVWIERPAMRLANRARLMPLPGPKPYKA